MAITWPVNNSVYTLLQMITETKEPEIILRFGTSAFAQNGTGSLLNLILDRSNSYYISNEM